MPIWRLLRGGGPTRPTGSGRTRRQRRVPSRPIEGGTPRKKNGPAVPAVPEDASRRSQLARRSDRLIDLGDKPAFDLRRLLRADCENTASLNELFEIGFDGQAGDIGRQCLQR